MTLRTRLIQLVLVAALPCLILAAGGSWLAYRYQLDTVKLNLLQTTRSIADVFGNELADSVTRAEVLAFSPYLTNEDFAAFYDHAREVLAVIPDENYWITLNRAADGAQILNTRRPLERGGNSYPDDQAAEWVREVVETQKPVIKNLRFSPIMNVHVVVVQVPVKRDGAVKYVLNHVIDARYLQAVLDRQRLPQSWIFSLFDRENMRVARSIDPESYIMTPPSPSLAEFMAREGEGVAWTVTLEGINGLTGVIKDRHFGWTIALSIPERELVTPVIRSAVWLFLAGIVVTLSALAAAAWSARTISRPIDALAEAASALGQERSIFLPRFGIKEMDAVGGALSDAADKLKRRTEERDANEAALQELNRTLEQRVEARTTDLAAAREQLVHAQKLEAVGQLTGGIAHDFNNVLTAVIGCFRLLERRGDSAAQDIARRGREAGERGARLTSQLLAFSRKQSLNPGPTDLADTIRRVIELMRQTVGPRVSLSVELAEDTWLALADAQQIELCLINLIFNARDAMPDGGEVRITTANVANMQGRGEFVALAVSDTGVGMSEEVKSRAFEPFFTTKNIGEGSGLGLSMVHGTVSQLGGAVEIASEPGRGTTVTLYLPRAGVRAVARPSGAPQAASGPVCRASVLLVDDDRTVRSVTADLLRDVGYDVREAASGREALETLRVAPPVDIAIVDYAMPGMDGAETIAQIERLMPRLPVIMFSGFAELPKDAALRYSLIRKPATAEALTEAIEGALAKAGARISVAS
jgi:signal transduction histidine kinase